MGDNSLFSSFMMLSEYLYDVFVQYIVHGRNRAPPENALIEMRPTFQFGAKTDRRALQSKFKSWAKRMIYENDHLKLANSGKIIIPKEKCDDLIMRLHSEEHWDIEKLETQIRLKYSWSRKNFGMDRDVIVETIMRKCKRSDCLKRMRIEMAKLGISLCSKVMDPEVQPFPEVNFGLPTALPYLPSYSYRWPLAFPVPHVFPPGEFPLQIPFFSSMYNNMGVCNQILSGHPMVSPNSTGRKRKAEAYDGAEANISAAEEAISTGSTKASEKTSVMKFKKPKNMHEYKALIAAVRNRPDEFPKILEEEKTQFLSVLGIAPKDVCSTRTLKKFRKEFRFKRLMNRDCMVYRQRKVLRDKNKLKKCSHGKPKHYFLEMKSRKDLTPSSSEKSRHDSIESKQPRPLKVSNMGSSEQNKQLSSTNGVKKAEEIEVIDISCSDDESEQNNVLKTNGGDENQSNNLLPENAEEMFKKKDLKIAEDNPEKHKTNENENPDRSETENIIDGNDKSFNAENNTNGSSKDEDAKENHPPETERVDNQKNKRDGCSLSKKPILLPKVLNNDPIENKLEGPSKVTLEAKHFQVPKIIVSDTVSRTNVLPNYSNYLFPSANATPIVIRQIIPSNVQRTYMVSDQNSVPRIVYPVPAAKPPPNHIKILLADREQKETIYVIPRPILPQNFPKSESQIKSDTEAPKMSSSTPLVTSQLQQLRQMKADKERILLEKMYHTDKKKIDISEEMTRISRWIYRMKANLNPNMFQHGIEKSVHKLLSQLDIGICLVREAKKSLEEIENSLAIEKPSEETVK